MTTLKELKGSGLLIHHWDTDGICSATLLLKHLKDITIKNTTPTLGNYYLTDEELNKFQSYDFIIIADMALPPEQIKTLTKQMPVIIFDHHLQPEIQEATHHNPIIKGENPDDYPSASWIVNTHLHNPTNLYALLGIIGDHEHKIKQNTHFNQIINTYCTEHHLSFDQLHKMTYLLDSNYKIGDKHAVQQTPHTLLSYETPQQILNNTTWQNNLEKLTNEINTLLSQPADERNGILLKHMNTTSNIISTVTRKISWETGKNTIVINTGFFPDKDQIYIRSTKNIEPMIQKGREKGYRCGGKKEVMGAIVPKKQTQQLVDDVITYLKT